MQNVNRAKDRRRALEDQIRWKSLLGQRQPFCKTVAPGCVIRSSPGHTLNSNFWAFFINFMLISWELIFQVHLSVYKCSVIVYTCVGAINMPQLKQQTCCFVPSI